MFVREAEQMRFVVSGDELTATIGDETAIENFAAALHNDRAADYVHAEIFCRRTDKIFRALSVDIGIIGNGRRIITCRPQLRQDKHVRAFSRRN